MRRKETRETNADPTPAQMTVITALMSGETVAAAAERAGVARQTVHRWLTEDAVFVAAFNRVKRDQRASVQIGLQALAKEAIDALRGILDPSRDTPPAFRLRAALAVLEMTGANTPESIGSGLPDVVQQEWADGEIIRKLASFSQRSPLTG
jgi:hypothetical protein